MRNITHRRMSTGGTKHEHITDVKWTETDTDTTGQSTREQMVTFIGGGGKAVVKDGTTTVNVLVVDATPKYIRTKRDDKWSDNLLSLPTF